MISEELIPNGKVKRLKDPCCGMETGVIYDAIIGYNYCQVLTPIGWTCTHWMPSYFEIVEKRDE